MNAKAVICICGGMKCGFGVLDRWDLVVESLKLGTGIWGVVMGRPYAVALLIVM